MKIGKWIALFAIFLSGGVLSLFHPTANEAVLPVQAAQEAQEAQENAPSLDALREASDEEIQNWADSLRSYNSCDYNLVTSVKYQGNTNICWAYGTLSTAETNILRKGIDPNATNENLDLDERNAAWAVANRDGRADPLNNTLEDTYSSDWNVGGGTTAVINVMSQGCIPTQEMTDHNRYGKVRYQLLNSYYIPNNVKAVKEAILRYGAVTVSYTVSTVNNYGYGGYYNHSGSGSGHLCSIVGWDDDAPANAFRPKKAEQNGGWIVKNSWGDYSSEVSGKYGKGYFVMSYENSGTGGIHAFDFGMKEDYPNIYLYDGGSSSNVTLSDVKDYGAIFAVKRADLKTYEKLKAVSLEVYGSNFDCTVKLYTNLAKVDPSNIQAGEDGTNSPEQGTPAETLKVHFAQKGTYTIPLDSPVDLEPGSYFSIVVEVSGDGGVASGGDYSSNDLTFYKRDGVWRNFKYQKDHEYAKDGLTARIRAITDTKERGTPLENNMRYVRVEFDRTILEYSKGAKYEPAVRAYLGDKLLDSENYTLTYSDNLKPGGATVTLTGKGDFKGEKKEHFLIKKADLPPNAPARNITVYSNVHYIADVPLPDGWRWMSIYLEQTLPYDYPAVAEYEGDDADCYIRTMTEVRIEYIDEAPDPIDLRSGEIAVEGEYTYTGSPIHPKLKVTVDGIRLKESVDYTVSLRDNIHHGTARLTVKGMGAYFGEKSASFGINKAPCPSLVSIIRVGEDAEMLSSVRLPENWAWKTDAKIGEGGEFIAVYKGEDAADYESCERSVVIERQVTEKKPVEPDKPTEPDTPTEPDKPTEPDTTTEPDIPTEPDKPTEPDAPTEPDVPKEPDTPTEPDMPTEPDEPTEPDIPTEPDAPTEPDTPQQPSHDSSTGPDHPDPPGLPSEEQTPSEPESPKEPETSSDSEASVKPDNAEIPDLPPVKEEGRRQNPLLWLIAIPAMLIPAAIISLVVLKRRK